ncbi:MAG TPA: peptidoglycan DD-metalloendopeptidase family protein [Gammaproteobacteria bacterium]|nr:peptidoglycan DD-metalloendopeptidase family protein [Gammaproteobacteria bacterium]
MAVVFYVLPLAGCGGGALAPVEGPGTESPRAKAAVLRTGAPESAPAMHVVEGGETLYAIAWRYGLDYQRIAEWNHIGPPYVIHAGQRLRLRGEEAQPAANQPASRPATAPASVVKPAGDAAAQAPKTIAANAPPPSAASVKGASEKERARPEVRDTGTIRWQWPARGRVVTSDTVLGQNGINILGTARQPIYAAAAGEVVYSGSGLIGYGKLIIIKHNDLFLSAYAHNDKVLVTEGVRVTAGQQIAEMGDTGAKQVMLHFEIRRSGKPVPPLEYLPSN